MRKCKLWQLLLGVYCALWCRGQFLRSAVALECFHVGAVAWAHVDDSVRLRIAEGSERLGDDIDGGVDEDERELPEERWLPFAPSTLTGKYPVIWSG